MTAAELLSAFIGDRVSRIEHHTRTDAAARPGYFYLRVWFESGRVLTLPIAREVGFSFDDDPVATPGAVETGDPSPPPDAFGIISENGVAAYPTEAAFLKEWEQGPTTGAGRRRSRRNDS